MDVLAATLKTVMENAAISGLCRDGQLEIVVQEGRKLRPDLGDDELYDLAKEVYGD